MPPPIKTANPIKVYIKHITPNIFNNTFSSFTKIFVSHTVPHSISNVKIVPNPNITNSPPIQFDILEHSDISGFSKTEQQLISLLVRNQRRTIHMKSLLQLSEDRAISALRCILLLRISVLFFRSHTSDRVPKLKLKVSKNKLSLIISKKWLSTNPLTESDLESERNYLKAAEISLDIIEK